MRLRLRSAAEADVAEAIRWYEEQKPGLGARFLAALDATLSNIEQNPQLYPVVHEHMPKSSSASRGRSPRARGKL